MQTSGSEQRSHGAGDRLSRLAEAVLSINEDLDLSTMFRTVLLGNSVNRARAQERRWELEVLLVDEHGLTLPPEREPLQESRKSEHLRWLREGLERARRQRVTAERWARLRMVLTLGLWRSG